MCSDLNECERMQCNHCQSQQRHCNKSKIPLNHRTQNIETRQAVQYTSGVSHPLSDRPQKIINDDVSALVVLANALYAFKTYSRKARTHGAANVPEGNTAAAKPLARRNIEKIRDIQFAEPWAQRWEDTLYSKEQWAADLRQSSPFAGVLEQIA